MDQSNVQSPDGVTLVGGGSFIRKDLVDSMALAPVVVAADGGANACLAEGIAPTSVIGDFDSIREDTLKALPGARLIRITEQDSTDFEKCLTRIDAPFVLAVGFAAKRLDHLLTVVSVMARQIGPPVILVSEEDVAFFARNSVKLALSPGTRVSLFPIAPVTGRSSGLRWPIDKLTLDALGMISTSNEATGPVSLELDDPGCLVILPRAELVTAIAALGD